MAIPPEIVDRVIDYVHDDTKTLIACSLTARDWVPSTRLHLFEKISLLSAQEVARCTELDDFAPYILHYCQELSIGSNNQFGNPSVPGFPPFLETPLSTISERIDRFTSLHTLHFRGFHSMKGPLLTPLIGISEKITAVTFTDSSLTSSYDLWRLLRLFPNLQNVHVSGLEYSSDMQEYGLAIAPGHCHSPHIISFSFHTHCQGFVLQRLVEPPYPLTRLTSLGIHHTDQQQHHLDCIAVKYQDAITTLRFSAHSTLGSEIPPHIGIYNRLHTLILGKLELFAAYPLSGRLPPTVLSFAWVTATIPCIHSRLTRLVFEVAVTERRDLSAISWEDIDTFVDVREPFEDLKIVEVVFLDTIPTTILGDLETPRPGIDLKEDLMRRMPRTVKRGLMKCSARGLRTFW